MSYLSLKIPGQQPGTSIEITPPPGIPSGSQFTVGFLSTRALELAMVVGIFVSLFYLIYGGAYWIQASGDKQKWDKARRTIVYSIFGLIIMSLSLVIVNVIAKAFGVETLVGN